MGMVSRRTARSASSGMARLLAACLAAILVLECGQLARALPNEIKIGSLFRLENETQQELVFRAAINEVNNNLDLVPKSLFVARIENVSREDSFNADQKACNLLKAGVFAILGPTHGAASHHVQAICDSLEVPHIEFQPDLALRRADLAINMYPSYDGLARAYIDLIQAWNWTSFAVIYDSSEAIIRLQDIFKGSAGPNAKRWSVKLFQLEPGVQFRNLFWEVKRSRENNILLDVRQEHMFDCLKQAQQVGLMTEKQNYLITSLDLHTINLDDFKYGKTRLTGLRMLDLQSKSMNRVLQELSRASAKNSTADEVLIDTAMIYDAVHLLAHGIEELDRTQAIYPHSLSCDSAEDTWPFGSSIINYMRSYSFDGLTGRISFDQSGRRTGFELDIVALSERGLEFVGKWKENAEVSLKFDGDKFHEFYIDDSDNIDTLVVTSKLTQPYFMLKATSNKQEGNDRYEGYAVDLIHEISKIVGFRYKFKEVSDGKYGIKNRLPNGTYYWDGMIGEILTGIADIGIVDFTITSSREEAVDFTLPFMNTGISILFKRPTNKVTTLFSFLSPFSLNVWVYVLCAYSGVSLILFIVGRIVPVEWTNPYPCRHEDQPVLKNSFTLPNAFWFTIGSLMQQGSDLAPKSMATRSMAGIWYFFTLIMISSYTANLAAFLTVEKIVYPIENAKDLSEQTDIKYGCVESGSTRTFFRDSQIETYKKIYRFMEKHNTYVKSNEEGRERVEQGNFAYFAESTSIEYITERKCNLTQIGSLLDSKNYGIGTRKYPPYRKPYNALLSQAILQLQESGMLHTLKNRWWKERHGVGSCGEETKGGGVTELSLANVGGVFVVLLGGMGAAFIVALVEAFLWLMRRKMDRDSICDQMMRDLKFAVSCQSSTKPCRKKMPRNESLTSAQNGNCLFQVSPKK